MKVKKTESTSIRFEPDVKATLVAIAQAEDRSLPYVVNRICKQAIDNGTAGDMSGVKRKTTKS
jgi:predicted transcriptional regulator